MPDKNKANTMYIGTRNGVEKNENSAHGLFGKCNGNEFGNFDDIKEISEHIKKTSANGTHMYRCVISMEEKDALRLGYDDRKEWENLIQENIFEIADKLKIPASRVEYVCAVHMEQGHPHMHFTLWDKEQPQVKRPYVHKSVPDKIRKELIKNVFKEELSNLYSLKNETRNTMTSKADDFFRYFLSMDNLSKQKRTDGYILNKRKMTDEFVETTTDKIISFKEKLPKTGRITYKTLSPELKKEMEGIVKYIIENDTDFLREYEKYLGLNEGLTTYFVSKSKLEGEQKKARENAEKDIMKRLSNKLLKEMKSVDYKKAQNENAKYQTLGILSRLFRAFSSENDINQTQPNQYIHRKGELSAQARKEQMMKQEHTGLDWEK